MLLVCATCHHEFPADAKRVTGRSLCLACENARIERANALLVEADRHLAKLETAPAIYVHRARAPRARKARGA